MRAWVAVVGCLLGFAFALVTAHAQEFVWAKSVGAGAGEGGSAAAVDAAGNVYVVGDFSGTVDFDPGPAVYNLTSAGSYDAFVWKLSRNGDFIWAKQLGGTSYDNGRVLALDGAGNILVTGYFQGTADFDPGPGVHNLTCSSYGDVFVTKLDGNGDFLWAKSFPGASLSNSETWSMALDSSGNVFTTGDFMGTIDFDPGPNVYNLTSGGLDVFVSKLDGNGSFVWARSSRGATSSDAAVGWSVGVDGAGNVYAAGDFSGTVDFDPGPGVSIRTSAGGDDGFVFKLDANGDFLWAASFGGAAQDYVYFAALDSAGRLSVTGNFGATVDFDPGPGAYNLTSAGYHDVFVVKLDGEGTLIWARRMGGALGDVGGRVAVDSAGNHYVAGYFQGTADLDPGPGVFNLTSAGGWDYFLSKLNGDGEFLWATRFGGAENDRFLTMALDGEGGIYTTGGFTGTADFDPDPNTAYNLTSSGNEDVFVFKLAQTPALAFAGRTMFTWSPLFGEAAYNTYRSDGPLPGTFVCLASRQTDPSTTDFEEPASGALYAYLVTAVNAVGQEGSMGFSAVNGTPTTERTNPNPCP